MCIILRAAQSRLNYPAINISEWEWSRTSSETNMYSFEYDPLDRLADSRHYLNASPSNSFEEKNISYDLNGNILTMTRVGESGDENEVTYSYSGNQLTSSIYDLNGNITYDVTSGLTMEWNHLDLIKKVSNNSGVLINYTYLSDGTKVRSVDVSGEGLEYRGSLTFRRSSDGTLTAEGIAFPGGRFVAMQGSDGCIQMVPNYHIADHLGSVRTIVDGSTGQVIEPMITMHLEADGTEVEASLTSPTATATTARRSRQHWELHMLIMEQGSTPQLMDDGLQWTRWPRSTTATRRMRSATTIR